MKLCMWILALVCMSTAEEPQFFVLSPDTDEIQATSTDESSEPLPTTTETVITENLVISDCK